MGFVGVPLQEAAQMEREPAESEDQNQTENCFRHFSTLFEVFTQGDPQASLLVPQHLAGHESVEHSRAGQRNAEVKPKQPPVLRVSIEGHEGGVGLQHARSHGSVPVLEGNHGEPDGLGHGEQRRQQPDPPDAQRRYHGNTGPLHPGPGSHRPVPVHTQSTQVEHGDADGGFLQEGKQLAEKQPEHTVCKRPGHRQQLVHVDWYVDGDVDQVS